MAKFIVCVPEVHHSLMLVEADDEQQAKQLAHEGTELEVYYNRTLDEDSNNWGVKKLELSPCPECDKMLEFATDKDLEIDNWEGFEEGTIFVCRNCDEGYDMDKN